MDFPASKSRVDWTALAFGVALSYLVFLVAMFVSGFWLRDAQGAIITNDFIDVFAAGTLANAGHAASAYDWEAHRAAEIAVAGHFFDGYYGWHYPPPFLFVASLLARLPYFVAFSFWIAVTLPLYAFAISRIANNRNAWLFALAFPAVLLNIYVGQNGLASAALIGATLLLMEDRPWLSGLCLGLLAYKPQFGILFPFVLLASGQWRVLASAGATVLAMMILSAFAFGTEAWTAFFHSIPHTTDMILAGGHAGWNKLQTIYGFVRWLGGSDHSAWIVQISVSLVLAAGVAFLWRSNLPFALKAAALCTAALLATPYAYIYDFPILAVSMAFLFRDRAFDRYEICVVAAAAALIAVFPWAGSPVALASTLLVASLITRRARKRGIDLLDVALQRG